MMTSAPATQFEREIREQPACLARLLVQGRSTAEEIARAVARFAPAFVVTAARGSSDNAARFAKYVFGGHNRLVVSLGAPSLITLYDSAPDLRRAVVIGISQSGESPDIVALLAEARRQGALTIAITNHTESPLARGADHVFDLQAGPERAIAATKSYTCQLLALAMLSAALEGVSARWDELTAVADAARDTLALHTPASLSAAIAPLANTNRMVVLGRGFNFATAFELALKMKESAYVMADPYATPDLFHGPLALIESGLPALIVAPRGPTLAGAVQVLDILAARGADVAVISDDATILNHALVRTALPIAPGLPEWLSPLVAVIPGQLCALEWARARGVDPDQPRGLAKITRTS